MLPKVVVVTPTYERHHFLGNLVYQFQYQKYPRDRLSIIILDDSPTEWKDARAVMRKDPRVKYLWRPEKRLLIAEKRNELNRLAVAEGAEIVVAMDDDDYYNENRVKHAVARLTSDEAKKTGALIAGSTEMYIYHLGRGKLYKVGPYHDKHGTNGTFAYHVDFLKDHAYEPDPAKNNGEEKAFTKGFTSPMVQLNPWETIICINHTSNTFDKTAIVQEDKTMKGKLKDIIKDKKVYNFFMKFKKAAEDNLAKAEVDAEKVKSKLMNDQAIAKMDKVPPMGPEQGELPPLA